MTTAKILADSINEDASRLTTFEIEVPKYMVAQLNTHRALSRNYESSRAKPFWRVLEQVITDPYVPKRFGKPSRGMQPAGYHEARDAYEISERWQDTAMSAAYLALDVAYINHGKFKTAHRNLQGHLNEGGSLEWFKKNPPEVAKETVNRILEPFMKVKGVISATEWDNFIDLRANPDAQDDINDLANQIDHLLDTNTPKEVEYGEWHLPALGEDKVEIVENIARVSYGNHRTSSKREVGTLYKELRDGGHWSPFEHVAQSGSDGSSNFDGSWTQLRQILGGN